MILKEFENTITNTDQYIENRQMTKTEYLILIL